MSETKLEVKTVGHSENFREDSETFRSDSLGLRKFRNHRENFAILAKFSL